MREPLAQHLHEKEHEASREFKTSIQNLQHLEQCYIPFQCLHASLPGPFLKPRGWCTLGMKLHLCSP